MKSIINAAFLLLLLLVAGCDRSRSASPVSAPADAIVPTVNFRRTIARLGAVETGQVLTADFDFANSGAAPTTMRVESVSCSCLDASVTPQGPLLPGSHGTVKVTLNTRSFARAGPIDGTVRLVSSVDRARHELQVFAAVEGLSSLKGFPDFVFVIRDADIRARTIPPLRLVFFALRPVNDLRIRSVSVSLDPTDRVVGDKQHMIDHALQFELLNVSPKLNGKRASDEVGYQVQAEIPIRLTGSIQNCRGSLNIEYVLNGVVRSARTGFLVIGAAPQL